MLTFLIVGLVLAGLAIATTVYAISSAKEGYEDEAGFHATEPIPVPMRRTPALRYLERPHGVQDAHFPALPLSR